MSTPRLAALLLCAAALGCACLKREFRLSGTVTAASSIRPQLPRTNTVLFIIVRNTGGVPIAVQRIVNPQFPVKYVLGPDDLIVPDPRPGTQLRVEVNMNAHGSLGDPVRGDFVGTHPNPVYPGDRRVHVVVDRQL